MVDDKLRSQLLDELCEPSAAATLFRDPYANYVVQRCLSVVTDSQGLRMLDALRCVTQHCCRLLPPHEHQSPHTQPFPSLSLPLQVTCCNHGADTWRSPHPSCASSPLPRPQHTAVRECRRTDRRSGRGRGKLRHGRWCWRCWVRWGSREAWGWQGKRQEAVKQRAEAITAHAHGPVTPPHHHKLEHRCITHTHKHTQHSAVRLRCMLHTVCAVCCRAM